MVAIVIAIIAGVLVVAIVASLLAFRRFKKSNEELQSSIELESQKNKMSSSCSDSASLTTQLVEWSNVPIKASKIMIDFKTLGLLQVCFFIPQNLQNFLNWN